MYTIVDRRWRLLFPSVVESRKPTEGFLQPVVGYFLPQRSVFSGERPGVSPDVFAVDARSHSWVTSGSRCGAVINRPAAQIMSGYRQIRPKYVANKRQIRLLYFRKNCYQITPSIFSKALLRKSLQSSAQRQKCYQIMPRK